MINIPVIPRLVLQMMPQYDFSVQRDDVLMLQCTVNNPDSLHDVINGSLVIKKGNAILTGKLQSVEYFLNMSTLSNKIM